MIDALMQIKLDARRCLDGQVALAFLTGALLQGMYVPGCEDNPVGK